jgi:hypothetical protein
MLRFSLSFIVEMMVSCGGKARAVIVAVVVSWWEVVVWMM